MIGCDLLDAEIRVDRSASIRRNQASDLVASALELGLRSGVEETSGSEPC